MPVYEYPNYDYQLTDEISDAWLKHVNTHAADKGSGYDYAVLRGVLPPSVGGTRMGGGGGISTLKRMLPLVARYLIEKCSYFLSNRRT